PEDHLLYLCLHGYKHSWYRLSWVVDLACLISTYPNLDWEAVIIQAKKYHIQRVIRLGLLLAHRLLKVQLPTIVHSWLEEDAKVDAILPTIIAQLAQINFKPNEQYSWAEHRYLMAGRERIRDKVWFTICRSFTLSEHDLASYPFSTHSLFLYRMLRPFRFLSHFLIPRKNN
ncbi:MAG: nucleotidyltransferase family protein, partial [Chloroflexi bacterium]|nr:nucleotidyltransferase family protein [Chloroflexota bacterium]